MWTLADKILSSRLLLGTANYPSLTILHDAVLSSQTNIVTVSLKRQINQPASGDAFWNYLKKFDCHFLPNTAGCRNAAEAITVAEMAREIFETHWIKLEVIGDDYNLQPHPFELVKAAKQLVERGFEVFPYCTDDYVICQRLIECGCRILMPWAAPIGSGKGLLNPYALKTLRARLPDCILIVDAGLGKPSHATQVLELGYDAVLVNSAIAMAADPVKMAAAFQHAVCAGRFAYESGMMTEYDFAQPSTTLVDTPFWQQVKEG